MSLYSPIPTIILATFLLTAGNVSAQLDVSLDQPDITATITKFKHRAKAAEDKLVAITQVRNDGSATLTDSFAITMWLSDTPELDMDALWLAEKSLDEAQLRPGEAVRVKLKAITDVAVDGRFVIIALDGDDEIPEIDEENNHLVYGIEERGCRKDIFLREREVNQPRIGAMRRGDCLTIDGQISDGDPTRNFVVDRDSFVVPTREGGTFHITRTFAENVDLGFTLRFQGPGRTVSGCVGAAEPDCTRFITASADSSFVIVLAPTSSHLGGRYSLDILLLPDFPALREPE